MIDFKNKNSWLNDFDNVLLNYLKIFNPNIEKKNFNKIKNDFRRINSVGDKYKYLQLSTKDKSINKNKIFFENVLNILKEYEDDFLKLSTNLTDLIINKIYTRLEISLIADNGDQQSGVLTDKFNNTFITIKLNSPYIYHYKNKKPTEENNIFDEVTGKIKYYAYTRENSSDESILANKKNISIYNATGFEEKKFIYAFINEEPDKYKYIGKYVNTKRSDNAPFYFELMPANSFSKDEILSNANNLYLSDIDYYSKLINQNEFIDVEDKKALIKIRTNQGVFREKLIDKYNYCPLTGIQNQNALIASHIKPYSKCTNEKDKIDVNNGILLSALADKFFDKGLITFNSYGEILYSNLLTESDILIFKKQLLTENINLELTERMNKNMEYHRKNIFYN